MLIRWTDRPTQRMPHGWREINRLLDETFGLPAAANGSEPIRGWAPAVDVSEDSKAYTLAIDLPGVRPEDVKIELDGKRLTVSGEKKLERDEKSDRLYRFERRFGSFQRVFTLPETVATDSIEARVEHGVLTLVLPKVEKAQPRSISIKAA